MIGPADIFQRTMMLIGEDKIEKLSKAKVAVCGLGGVGSFAFEALVRCGVGNFIIVDKDRIVPSNLNRQLIATMPSIGRYKVEIARERAVEINPFVKIEIIPKKVTSENIYEIFENVNLDYIVDAIDDIGAKVALIKFSSKENIKIISCMGMGNRINPLLVKVSDIYSTRYCPLAKKLRSILRKENIKSLKVVYSEEKPSKPDYRYLKEESEKKHVPASISFVPPVAGFIMAYEVVKDLVFGD